MIGFDYTDRIAPAALRAAGCSVAIRYTTWSGWPKSLTPGEADELHAAGIPIAANFESTADRMLGGYAAGHADAIEARGHLGDDHMPTGLKVWFSADWDVQPGQVPAVLDYMHGAADGLGSKDLAGLYGGLRAVRAAADAGFAIWQTVAWSGGVWDPRAVARQTGEQRYVGGVQVDVNEIINLAGLGAWGGPTSGEDVSASDVWSFKSVVPGLDPIDMRQRLVNAESAAEQARDQANAIKSELDGVNGKLDQVLARPAVQPAPVDVNALAAALVPHLHDPANSAAIAQEIVAHLGLQVVAK